MRALARQLDPFKVRTIMKEFCRSETEFFKKYGGGRSIGYDLIDDDGRTYPPAAIVQAAVGKEDVKGGLKHSDSAGAALIAHGFRVVRKGTFLKAKESREDEIEKLLKRLESIQQTEKESKTKRRVGQDTLRKFLHKHRGACEITGISDPDLLRASHIVSWSDDEKSRLDPDNVIFLSCLWDAAFDKGLISFSDEGVAMNLSLSDHSWKVLRMGEIYSLPLTNRRRKFLVAHRKKFGS